MKTMMLLKGGKWHMAINHNAFPQPEDRDFGYSRHNLGVTRKMTPHRLTGFATDDPGDPYRLDGNGFPYHQNSEDALDFLRENKDTPFFLHYAAAGLKCPLWSGFSGLITQRQPDT